MLQWIFFFVHMANIFEDYRLVDIRLPGQRTHVFKTLIDIAKLPSKKTTLIYAFSNLFFFDYQ